MLEILPINKEQWVLIQEEISKFPRLKSYYLPSFEKLFKAGKLTRDNPLINYVIQRDKKLDYLFLEHIEKLIEFHEGKNTKGLKSILSKESINNDQFFHTLSQLELGFDFIKKGFGVVLEDDLILERSDHKIYLEIKTFQEFEMLGEVIDSIRGIKSEFWLEIEADITNSFQIKKLKEEVTKIIGNQESENKILEVRMADGSPIFAKVKFNKKDEKSTYENTGIICRTMNVKTVDDGYTQKKIKDKIDEGHAQLMSKYKNFPKLIVFDIANSSQTLEHSMDEEDFRELLYGARTMVSKQGVPPQIYAIIIKKEIEKHKIIESDEVCNIQQFPYICKEFLLSNKEDTPSKELSYLSKRGIYFDTNYPMLNGVIIRQRKQINLFPNPFIVKELSIDENNLKILFDLKDDLSF
ncbi:hypothetical protein HYY71_00075 [Candidatus Woesearchaeota archaeon]|nr:hypothetical protein [Candidatus Woesearchaeota archaeon]